VECRCDARRCAKSRVSPGCSGRWRARRRTVHSARSQKNYSGPSDHTLFGFECSFSILSRSTLRGGNFTSVRRLVEAIEAFVASWNQKAAPFEWTKAEVHQQQMKTYYSDLRN
jgi:hypothetical protein